MKGFQNLLLVVFGVIVGLMGFVAAIYPDDHFEYSTKLTAANFEKTIEDAIASDRTLFVRWVASAG